MVILRFVTLDLITLVDTVVHIVPLTAHLSGFMRTSATSVLADVSEAVATVLADASGAVATVLAQGILGIVGRD